MTYLPFARKYRPQTFADLIGQPHVTTTLTRALESQRITQAYLFAGLRGVGKTSAARILAKCLNCEKGPTATPCNRCASCTQITIGNSLDVIEIDGASNRGIDEIRSLRETVPFAPTSGPYRIYIIDEVHMLTLEAFNALLKTLEEPPAHAKFIFATTAPNKVPVTILSRCQRFDFRRIEPATMVEALQRLAKAERLAVDEPALYAIARASEGSVRDAEVILEQLASFVEGAVHEADVTALLGAMESEALFAWTQAILDHNAPDALAVLMGQLDQGKEPPQLLAGLLRHIRNLLIIRSIEETPSREAMIARLVDEPAERLTRLKTQAGSVAPQELLLFLQIVSGAYELVRRSPMAQTILEMVVIKLATREAWQSLDQISRRLEQLGPGAPPSRPLQTSASAPPARAPVATSAASAAKAPPSLPVSVEAPAPTTVARSGSAPDALVAQWPVFLERLGAKKMSLAAYLAEAKPMPMHLDGGILTIGLPAFALHQEVLTVLENRRLIERLLSELLHAPVAVQYATLPEPEPGDDAPVPQTVDPAAPSLVQDIVKLFNATVVNQPPRTT